MSQKDYEQISRFIASQQAARAPTEDEMDACLRPITDDELPQVRCDITQTAHRIFQNWDTLASIVHRHEAVFQKRWIKKSKVRTPATRLSAH